MRFPKSERLKERKWIERLFTEGTLTREGALTLRYVAATWEDVRLKAGFSVSKKRFRRAVDRNRIKRLMREAYRLEKNAFLEQWPGSWALMFLFTGKEIPNLEYLRERMRRLTPPADNKDLP